MDKGLLYPTLLFKLPVRQTEYAGTSMRFLVDLFHHEEAATSVEYAVMLALILGVILGAIGSFGRESGGLWSGINTHLHTVGFMK
jgi:Flp pilus assembly pilin Flp